MATIYNLNKSISLMTDEEAYQLISLIRTNRRNKPDVVKPKKKQPSTKMAKRSTKNNLKQQDIFAYVKGLSEKEQSDLIASLLNDA